MNRQVGKETQEAPGSSQEDRWGFRLEGPGNMEAETEHLVGHLGGGRNQGKDIGVRAAVVLGDSS